MDDPRWLRLVTIGLVLAAIAVGYFLLSGRLASNSVKKPQTQLSQATPTPSPTLIPVATASPIPTSAYQQAAIRVQNQAQNLPNTGFPVGAAVLFSISAIISGFGLRKFPH